MTSIKPVTPVIRPMTKDERNRSVERELINSPHPTLEERVVKLEEFVDFMMKQPDIAHAIGVHKMIAEANRKREVEGWNEQKQKDAEEFTPTEFFLKNYGKTA